MEIVYLNIKERKTTVLLAEVYIQGNREATAVPGERGNITEHKIYNREIVKIFV